MLFARVLKSTKVINEIQKILEADESAGIFSKIDSSRFMEILFHRSWRV